MNWVNIKKFAGGAAMVAASMGLASQALALDLIRGDAYYMGQYVPPEPASPSNEVQYINVLKGLNVNVTDATSLVGYTFTRSSNVLCYNTCPTATITDAIKNDNPAGGNVNLGDEGFDYLVGKYDGPNGGGLVWYVAGLTGPVTIPTNAFGKNDSQYGLSHYSLYNFGGDGPTPPQQIPEPASLALVGLGLAGLALTRRRRQR